MYIGCNCNERIGHWRHWDIYFIYNAGASCVHCKRYTGHSRKGYLGANMWYLFACRAPVRYAQLAQIKSKVECIGLGSLVNNKELPCKDLVLLPS
jgi:hypothetical protein